MKVLTKQIVEEIAKNVREKLELDDNQALYMTIHNCEGEIFEKSKDYKNLEIERHDDDGSKYRVMKYWEFSSTRTTYDITFFE